ncbi:MAG: TetR/AcrR family transcriptional regulator [Subtercola sp.]|nr:TetR/AcrR family transcriptional regulator [Subtercola sp.]
MVRADAQANHDRILIAAAQAFVTPGADTSMKSIAQQAGVGIGTLYRRFPTREDLIEATYRSETERLAASGETLLAGHPPTEALRLWMESFVDYMHAKLGMAEALPAVLSSRDGLRAASRTALRDAIAAILRAGTATGELRPDVAADDVMMAIGGVTLISQHENQRELATRLIGIVIAGLSAR